MGEKTRRWYRFSAELLVVVLLAAAVLSYRYDLGEHMFGRHRADPVTEPAAVLPPEGLRLPTANPVPAVATPGAAVAVNPARVAAAVRPLLSSRVLGRHFGVLVTDASTGQAVYRQGVSALTPASTAKLLTSTAALAALGPMARFRTSVRWVPSTRQLVLVGGGDPFLASTPALGAASYPRRADVTTLAQHAVTKLRAIGVRQIRLGFDDSYFTGPAVNPAWPRTYLLPVAVVSPISALWVDEARSPTGDVIADPAAYAAQVFRTALRSNGMKVGRAVSRARVLPGAIEVASVLSAPLGEIVERTLAFSDNRAAEVLARHVGLAERQEGSFEAGAAAVLDVVRRLGVPLEAARLYDGSGLSRGDRLSTDTLAAVLRLAQSPDRPELRTVFTGLPVAGFTGSLQYRFDQGPAQARGRVRAKTGTLTGVHGLAGLTDGVRGGRMAFVVIADRVPPSKDLQAQELIDRVAGALGACPCGVGSSP